MRILARLGIGVYARVRQGAEQSLMHPMVANIDRRLRRDGSANWSASGERSRDSKRALGPTREQEPRAGLRPRGAARTTW